MATEPFIHIPAGAGRFGGFRVAASTTLGLGAGVAVWSSPNVPIYIPVVLGNSVTVRRLMCSIRNASGTLDIGVYDEFLAAKLCSTGPTAAVANSPQHFTAAPAATVLAAGRYYIGVAGSTAVGLDCQLTVFGSLPNAKWAGILVESSSTGATLPAVPVTVASTVLNIPFVGICQSATL